MKKFCSFLMALVCVTALFTGCAGNPDGGTDGNDGGNGQTPPEQTEDVYTYEEQIADAQAIHENLMNAYFGIQETAPSASALAYSVQKGRSFEDILEEMCTDELSEADMKAVYSTYFLVAHPLNELFSLYGTESLTHTYRLDYELVNAGGAQLPFAVSDVLPGYIDFAGVLEENGTKYALSYVEYPEFELYSSMTLHGNGYFKAYYNSDDDYGYEIILFDTDKDGEFLWGSLYSIHKAKDSVAVMRQDMGQEPWGIGGRLLINDKIDWNVQEGDLSDEFKTAAAEYFSSKYSALREELAQANEQNKVGSGTEIPETSVKLEVDYKLIEATMF